MRALAGWKKVETPTHRNPDLLVPLPPLERSRIPPHFLEAENESLRTRWPCQRNRRVGRQLHDERTISWNSRRSSSSLGTASCAAPCKRRRVKRDQHKKSTKRAENEREAPRAARSAALLKGRRTPAVEHREKRLSALERAASRAEKHERHLRNEKTLGESFQFALGTLLSSISVLNLRAKLLDLLFEIVHTLSCLIALRSGRGDRIVERLNLCPNILNAESGSRDYLLGVFLLMALAFSVHRSGASHGSVSGPSARGKSADETARRTGAAHALLQASRVLLLGVHREAVRR